MFPEKNSTQHEKTGGTNAPGRRIPEEGVSLVVYNDTVPEEGVSLVV